MGYKPADESKEREAGDLDKKKRLTGSSSCIVASQNSEPGWDCVAASKNLVSLFLSKTLGLIYKSRLTDKSRRG